MNKILIIIRREFITRVRKKLFLVSTLLTPIFFLAIMIVPGIIASFSGTEKYDVTVIDPSGKIVSELVQFPEDNMSFRKAEATEEEIKEKIRKAGKESMEALLVIQSDISREQVGASFYAAKVPPLEFERDLDRKLERILSKTRYLDAGLTAEQMKAADVKVSIEAKKLTEEGEESGSAVLGTVLGFAMGILTYMMIFVYGSILMSSVMEEKTNRIVEVIVSSVKPLQLMIGKIIGVGAVGLLQYTLWVLLIIVLGTGAFFAFGLTGSDLAQGQEISAEQQAMAESMAPKIVEAVESFDPSIIFFFIFFFLTGYLLYGSLFAAIGAAIDQESDAQPLTTALTIPAIIPLMVLGAVIKNPAGPLAFWLSMVPFFSPTIMMARLAASDVPAWEILLSMAVMILGVFGTAWVAAKIYRVGLLLYGKKITLKELFKWVTKY